MFRELNKVYTNGTLVDAELLTDDQAGHCISICEEFSEDGSDSKNNFGICVLDCSTSQFNLSAFEDDVCRTKLETLMRQLRPKEVLFTKVIRLPHQCGIFVDDADSFAPLQGTLSVSTTRLLKSVLQAACLWTSLRDVEGFGYDVTLQELKTLYPADDDENMDDDAILSESVPESIRSMVDCKNAITALGSMIWYVGTLFVCEGSIR